MEFKIKGQDTHAVTGDNGKTYYMASAGTREHAQVYKAYMDAMDAIKKAEKLMDTLSVDLAVKVGHVAYDMCHTLNVRTDGTGWCC